MRVNEHSVETDHGLVIFIALVSDDIVGKNEIMNELILERNENVFVVNVGLSGSLYLLYQLVMCENCLL